MTKNGIAERVSHMGDRARERMTHARLEKLDRDNDRLRGEVSLLRDDLQQERDALREAVKALGDDRVTVTERPNRRPHVIRTLVVAGTAYVLGTKAGRERYEWILGRVRAMRDAMRGSTEDVIERRWDESEVTSVGAIDEGRRGTAHGV